MVEYFFFGVGVFMLGAALASGSFGWVVCWLYVIWSSAVSVAEGVQRKEALAAIPASLRLEFFSAYMAAKSQKL